MHMPTISVTGWLPLYVLTLVFGLAALDRKSTGKWPRGRDVASWVALLLPWGRRRQKRWRPYGHGNDRRATRANRKSPGE